MGCRMIRRRIRIRQSRGKSRDMATKVAMPLILGIAVLVVAGVLLWRAKWGTDAFATVDAGVVYRDGNRGEREFVHALERGKIRTVVDLVDDSELADKSKPELAEELGWCQTRGVKVERVAVKLGGWPRSED